MLSELVPGRFRFIRVQPRGSGGGFEDLLPLSAVAVELLSMVNVPALAALDAMIPNRVRSRGIINFWSSDEEGICFSQTILR